MLLRNSHIPVLFFLLLAAGFQNVLHAQDLTWSNLPRLNSKANYSKVLGENEDGIFLLRHKNEKLRKNFYIEKYSHDLAYLQSKQVRTGSARVEKLFTCDQGIGIILSDNDDKTGSKTITYTLHPSDLNSDISASLTVTIEGYDFGLDLILADFDPDRKLAVVAAVTTQNGNAGMDILLLNTDGKKLYSRHIQTSYPAQNFSISDVLADTAGNAFVLASFTHPGKKKGDPSAVEHLIYCVSSDGQRDVSYTINNTRTFISQPRLIADRINGNVMATGFYGYREPESMHGIFNVVIESASLKSEKSFFTPLSDKTLVRLIGEDNFEKGADPNNFRVRRAIARSDGGVALIAECYYVSTQNETFFINGIPQTTSRSIYNYDDILAVSMDPAGNLQWEHVIPKRQNTLNENGYFSSVAVCTSDSLISILYNENTKISGNVLQYTITPGGWLDQKIILRSDQFFTAILPFEYGQVGYNRMVIPCQRNRQVMLLKLRY